MILRADWEASRPVEVRALERLRWLRPGSSWEPWRTAVRALLADPLTGSDLDVEALRLYTRCTGRTVWPIRRSRKGYWVVSRRSGKTLTACKVVVGLACFLDVRALLAAGEVATVALVSVDRKSARTAYRYVLGLLKSDPALWALVVGEPTLESITLSNGIVIEIHVGSWKSVRGYTLLAAVVDEAAFALQTVANPIAELIAAVEPGLATLEDAGSLLLIMSSPHSRRDALGEARDRLWGANDCTEMFWQSDSLTMNPTLKESTIERAMLADPARARAEWGGQFREDLETYVTREMLGPWIPRGVSARTYRSGYTYVMTEDPAGGGVADTADGFAWAVAHCEVDAAGRIIAVLDLVDEMVPPVKPEVAVATCASVAKRFDVRGPIKGDSYAGRWPGERHGAYGLVYEPAGISKSDAYLALLPELADGRIRLLDHPKLLAQFYGLERAAKKGGRDSVDHAPRGHDDLANAATLALLAALDSATAESLGGAPEPDAYDRSVLDSFAAFADAPRSGEVVDHEAGFTHDDYTWRRTGADGISRPLW